MMTWQIDKDGDHGQTKLLDGSRISKASLRVEILGTIDELSCALGVARAHVSTPDVKKMIFDLQRLIFRIGSEIAANSDEALHLKYRIDEKVLEQFEAKVEALNAKTPSPTGFIISGSNIAESHIQLARSVTRRCERLIVAYQENKKLNNPFILPIMNRMSVYLFLLALQINPKPDYLADHE